MSVNNPDSSTYYHLYAFLFAGALFTFVHRFVAKPEQLWYKGRALAESVKTSTWKYIMKAAPFDMEDTSVAAISFKNHLKAVISANQFAGEKLPADAANKLQLTDSMNAMRRKTHEVRLEFYINNRVVEQRGWYARKATHNERLARRWAIACLVVYTLAIISSLTRAEHPTWDFLPTEPLIAGASAVVGWMQTKRFNELASSYTLTAHEISLVQAESLKVVSDKSLSDFIDDAELAFSREHTQWVARQND